MWGVWICIRFCLLVWFCIWFCAVRVITPRVDSHAGDPLGVGLQFFCHFLFHQVVDPDRPLRCHEEIGPDGVEGHTLNQTFVLPEGVLTPPPAQLVDEHLQVTRVIRHHRGQVVSFSVPHHLVDGLRRGTLIS